MTKLPSQFPRNNSFKFLTNQNPPRVRQDSLLYCMDWRTRCWSMVNDIFFLLFWGWAFLSSPCSLIIRNNFFFPFLFLPWKKLHIHIRAVKKGENKVGKNKKRQRIFLFAFSAFHVSLNSSMSNASLSLQK